MEWPSVRRGGNAFSEGCVNDTHGVNRRPDRRRRHQPAHRPSTGDRTGGGGGAPPPGRLPPAAGLLAEKPARRPPAPPSSPPRARVPPPPAPPPPGGDGGGGSLGPADVRAHVPALARAGAVVADGNLPVPCLRELLQVCEEHNKPLIFDPVSEAKAARSIAAGVLEQSTLLTPNIGELKAFFLELKKKNSAAILARSGGKLIFDNPSPDERRANHKMATSEVKAMLEEIVPFALPILDSQSQQHRKGSPSKYLLVTLGQDGAVLLSKDSATDDLFEALYFPAVTENHEVVDVNGAGDALTAALALGMATGERIDKSMQRGVYIASQVVKSEFRLPKNELLQENMSDEKLNAVVPIQSQLLYFDDNNH